MYHTFANHIDEDYAYTLYIPASYLLKMTISPLT